MSNRTHGWTRIGLNSCIVRRCKALRVVHFTVTNLSDFVQAHYSTLHHWIYQSIRFSNDHQLLLKSFSFVLRYQLAVIAEYYHSFTSCIISSLIDSTMNDHFLALKAYLCWCAVENTIQTNELLIFRFLFRGQSFNVRVSCRRTSQSVSCDFLHCYVALFWPFLYLRRIDYTHIGIEKSPQIVLGRICVVLSIAPFECLPTFIAQIVVPRFSRTNGTCYCRQKQQHSGRNKRELVVRHRHRHWYCCCPASVHLH